MYHQAAKKSWPIFFWFYPPKKQFFFRGGPDFQEWGCPAKLLEIALGKYEAGLSEILTGDHRCSPISEWWWLIVFQSYELKGNMLAKKEDLVKGAKELNKMGWKSDFNMAGEVWRWRQETGKTVGVFLRIASHRKEEKMSGRSRREHQKKEGRRWRSTGHVGRRVFHKNTFSKKKLSIPPRLPTGHI